MTQSVGVDVKTQENGNMSEIKMTPERRAEARARCKAATKGQWEEMCDEHFHIICGNVKIATMKIPYMPEQNCINSIFMSSARQDLPDALDTIDALEAENAALKDELEKMRDM